MKQKNWRRSTTSRFDIFGSKCILFKQQSCSLPCPFQTTQVLVMSCFDRKNWSRLNFYGSIRKSTFEPWTVFPLSEKLFQAEYFEQAMRATCVIWKRNCVLWWWCTGFGDLPKYLSCQCVNLRFVVVLRRCIQNEPCNVVDGGPLNWTIPHNLTSFM